MDHTIKAYVTSCRSCQLYKPSAYRKPRRRLHLLYPYLHQPVTPEIFRSLVRRGFLTNLPPRVFIFLPSRPTKGESDGLYPSVSLQKCSLLQQNESAELSWKPGKADPCPPFSTLCVCEHVREGKCKGRRPFFLFRLESLLRQRLLIFPPNFF